ncbi:hypothetical protein FM069_16415 [Pseudomonas mangiferae]|uniref:Uncharacterized protein n=1 Tax=Pseudomonas mangiferae TaxID=2593654 RepID=A0A553GW70_9PSED|nr:hypothetical protein FM069_16415 [Pseudomonas mangiferae]
MHNKRLQYTVRIAERNPANRLLEQIGGPQGEWSAANDPEWTYIESPQPAMDGVMEPLR